MSSTNIFRVFFDADALIAGSASSTGASHVLLRLCEAGVIRGVTCAQVVREVERNLVAKLPAALPVFRTILGVTNLDIRPDSPSPQRSSELAAVHPDDRPILISALDSRCDFLVTFNLRHYRGVTASITIATPGDVLNRVRDRLAGMA